VTWDASTESPAVAATIAGYQPRGVSADCAAFARSTVTAAEPNSAIRARALLWSCARLAAFGQSVGLEPRAELLLVPSTVERFVAVGLAQAPVSRRRSVRSNLRFVARRAGPAGCWPPEPFAYQRSRVKAPFTSGEIEAFLALAGAQPTIARRHRLSALVCLGAGAGICGAELRHLRGPHIAARPGGLVVVIGGGRARVVPVLGRYHETLLAAAAFAGEGYLIGGLVPGRHNLTSRLVATVSGGADLPAIDGSRLRSTWLAACAAQLGLPALLAAAGVRQSQQLADLIAILPVPDEAELIARLGSTP
jgi:integrase